MAVADNHTAGEWAENVRRLVEKDYPDAERITLVMDNLNTHTGASLYKKFEPAVARKLLNKLEFVHTPKHGSWLNIAENELSSMTRQSLHKRRFSTIAEIRKQTTAWATATNRKQRGVDWQFEIDNARTKLKYLYPKIKTG